MKDKYKITADLITKQPTDVWGLSFFPSLEPHYGNDMDMPYSGWEHCIEISDCNLAVVKHTVAWLGDRLKATLEIGVNRNKERSLSQVFIHERPRGSFYLGVDINDKSELDDHEMNTWTLRCNSHEQKKVRNFLASKGVTKLDLISIDGWHSVDTTVNDWRYTDMLSDHGVVVVHDTNFHPGDIALVEAVDENLFDKIRMCVGHDSGITVFVRKQPGSLESFTKGIIT